MNLHVFASLTSVLLLNLVWILGYRLLSIDLVYIKVLIK